MKVYNRHNHRLYDSRDLHWCLFAGPGEQLRPYCSTDPDVILSLLLAAVGSGGSHVTEPEDADLLAHADRSRDGIPYAMMDLGKVGTKARSWGSVHLIEENQGG